MSDFVYNWIQIQSWARAKSTRSPRIHSKVVSHSQTHVVLLTVMFMVFSFLGQFFATWQPKIWVDFYFHYILWKWQSKHSVGTRISNYFHYPTTKKAVFCFLRSYDLFNPTLTNPISWEPLQITNLICSCKISFQVKFPFISLHV
jgi:hypothetical protein